MTKRLLCTFLAASWLCAGVAWADEPKLPAPSTSSSAAASAALSAEAPRPEASKAEAREHFERGLALLEDEAWDAALAEFLRSRSLFATRAATTDAAICLRKLHRFDEAVDMLEALLREFPTLPADERVQVQAQIKDLTHYVGTIAVLNAEPGSKILIDGRERGEAPSPPMRVSAGTHVLRVFREGFAPFEAQVSVAGGQPAAVSVRLQLLLQGGRLHVEEATGQTAKVFVDGAELGITPWDGVLPVGDHVLTLSGEGNLGTQPTVASVHLNSTTPIKLRAEPLSARLRIVPTPSGASVILDSVATGRGAWTGPVREGPHVIEVSADGFVTQLRRIALPAGKETTLEVALPRPEVRASERPGRAFVEADAGFAIAPSLGGALSSGCTGTCSKGVPFGFQVMAHGGYQLSSGLGLLIDAGYLSLSQQVRDRSTPLIPLGLDANEGTARDRLTLSGLTIGGAAQYRHGDKLVILGRLGVGALLGTLDDRRTGNATSNERTTTDGTFYPAQRYSFDISESPPARSLYVAPELRLGMRASKGVELSVGLRSMILVAISQPSWTNQKPIVPGASYGVGQVRFPRQELAGSVIVVGALTLGARFEF